MLRSFVAGLGVVVLLGACSDAGTTVSSLEMAPPGSVSTASTVDLSTSTSEAAASTTAASTTSTSTVVTTTTVATTATATTTTTEPIAGLVLSADGLGVVSFEEPMDDVLTILIDLLGPPTSDEVVEPAFSNEKGYSFGYFRWVRWWDSSVKLYVEFVNWSLNWDTLDTPVFSFWGAGSGEIPLQTVEGVGPGTPWHEAAEIYGDRTETNQDSEECGGRWHYVIDGGTGNPFHTTLHGILDGDPSDPATSITGMDTGRKAFPQGC